MHSTAIFQLNVVKISFNYYPSKIKKIIKCEKVMHVFTRNNGAYVPSNEQRNVVYKSKKKKLKFSTSSQF